MTEKEKKIEKDRKRLRKSIERLEHLFSELDRGVLVEDREREIIYANQSFCDMFGIPSPEVVTGMDCKLAAITASGTFQNPSEFLEDLQRIIEEGKTVRSQRLNLKDGRIFSRDFIVGELDSKVIGNIWLYRDVTREKQKEEEIKKSNQQWEMFFSQSISGIFFMMLDEPVRWDNNIDKEKALDYVFSHQKINRVNEAMLKQFRAEESDLTGLTPADLFHHNISEGKRVWRKLFDDGRIHIITQKPRFDGSMMTLEGDYICMYDDYGRITGHFGIQKDVTERDEYQHLLRKSKEKYKNFYLNAPVAYQSLNEKGEILNINHKWSEETGYSPEEAKGKTFSELLDEPSSHLFRENFIRLQRSEPTKRLELNLRRKDGSFILIQIQGSASFGDDGKFHVSNCIFNNITNERNAERALQENQQQLQAIFDNALIGIGYTDLKGTIIKVNKAFAELLGYSDKELKGLNFSAFTHPEDSLMEMNIIREMLSGHERFAQYEKRYITKSGKTIWVSIGVSVIYDKQGQPINLVGTVKDETLRKETELRENRRRELENLRTEIWKSASLFNDEDALISDLLEKAGPVLGVENLSFMPYDQHEKEVVVKLIWRSDNKQVGVGETIPIWVFKPYLGKAYGYLSFDNLPAVLKPVLNPFMKKYGTRSSLVIPYGDPKNPEGFLSASTYSYNKTYNEEEISVFREISKIIYLRTQQIRKDRTIRENETRLAELNSTKDKIFSIIGHDLKNPIHAINGFSELIKTRRNTIEENSLLKYISLIHQASHEASVLLSNLLDWARIQSGNINFSPQRLRIGELLKPVIGIMKLSMEEKNLQLVTEYDEDQVVYADAKMLDIVMRNLLSNAIKFSYRGGKIIVRAEKWQEGVKISLIDEGKGISKKDLPLLFKVDENFTTRGTQNEKGTGLGLILCQEFLRQHGSKLELESVEGKGSRFCFVLKETER